MSAEQDAGVSVPFAEWAKANPPAEVQVEAAKDAVPFAEFVGAASVSDSASGEEFDPGEHTVADVLDHLVEHPEDRQRVIDAESAGKGRKGILDAADEEND